MYISALYLALFFMSLFATYVLLKNIVSKRAGFYVALFVLISVVCAAYFAYSIASDAGMVLVANQFTYFDGTFMLTFFLFCVLDICNIKIKPLLAITLTACNIFFLGLAFTADKNQLLYEKYWYGVTNGAAHIEVNLGPLHIFYVIYGVINTLAPLAIVVYSAFQKKKISFRYTIALGALEFAIIMMYFLESAFGLFFDILPCGYVLMEYVILAILQRIALYDGAGITIYNSEKRNDYGFIIFDRSKAYVSSNTVAKFFFPELENQNIDSKVQDEFLINEFVSHFDEISENDEIRTVVERKGRFVLCTIKQYIPENSKKVHGYIVEIHDDTEQQTLINELNMLNEELKDAAELSKQASKAKSDFLASMSHEIRTPINAIMGMNEIALRECKDSDVIPYLNDIKSAGTNLLRIINDILDFSKIEAGKVTIIDSDYDMVKVIKDVKDLVEVRAEEKDIELILDIDENLPTTLYGDENRIRQIMINILNNAVKYTNEGYVKFKVTGDYEGEKNLILKAEISDTGIGIKEEDMAGLFESFTRLDEKKNNGVEGTGLGLAITNRLTAMMGGTIDVKSKYGEGSVFTVSLPQLVVNRTKIGDFKAAVNVIRSKPEAYEHIDASGTKILIVDDIILNLKVAAGLLKVTKADIDTAISGRECLEKIRTNTYDIVLLDQMMPDMDGVETLHEAKKMKEAEGIIFIALTANAVSGAKESLLDEGFDGYLSKPIDSKKMEKLLKKYIKH